MPMCNWTIGPWPEVKSELTYLPYFNVAAQSPRDGLKKSILPERQGVTDTRTVLSSVRLDRPDRLIIGSDAGARVQHPRFRVFARHTETK
jgi:hypothetical protein